MLLEALVAILLFITGIVGLLGLQARMTQAQTESRMRADAAYLAQELQGLMWANISDLNGYATTIGSGSTSNCSNALCNTWLVKAKATLPQGDASIAVENIEDGSVGADVDITITWTMPNGVTRKYMTAATIARDHTP